MMKEILDNSRSKMQKAIDTFSEHLETIRTGRATTLEELKTVASLTKNVVEILRSNDCLGGLPESDQMTLF